MRATHAGNFGGRLDDLLGSGELPKLHYTTITPSSPNHQINSQLQQRGLIEDGSYPGYLNSALNPYPPTMTPLTQCLLGHAGGAAAGGEDGRPESGARAVASARRRESGIETADASQDSNHNDKQQLNIDVVDIKSTSHHVSINRKRRESQSLFLKAKKMPSDKFECIPIKVWNGLAMDGVKVQ